MSTYTATEQATPATPSAGQQTVYPKVGGQYVIDSGGLEKQIVAGQGSPSGPLMQYLYIQFGGM
jgi:hypothetical protein